MRRVPGNRLTRLAFVFSVLMVAGTAPLASATALLKDSFSYPNVDIVQPGGANGGWYSHSGFSVGPQAVVDGTNRVRVAPAFNEDISRPFLQQGATAKTYASFTIRVASGSVITLTENGASQPQYFAHFRSGASDSAAAFRARVALLAPRFGGNYTVGIDVTSYNLTTQPFVPWTADLNFDQTYNIKIAYDANGNGTAILWVNPVNEASPSVQSLGATAAAGGIQVRTFALRQGTPAAPDNATVFVDDLGVATTFDETKPAAAVPSLSQWGTMALGMLLLGAGFLFVRRRSAPAIA